MYRSLEWTAPGVRVGSRGDACRFLLAAAVLLAGLGCPGRPPPPPPSRPAPAPAQEGIATHYAARFEGRKTASGEPYRAAAMTAAHRTLPLGTRVRVTRIDARGNRVAGPIEVRINDRGPYGRGRIIDLSSEAARRLGMLGGLARVRVEILEKPH
jgi:rare lipoprotein A